MFVKIEKGAVAQYPYTLEQMRLDNPNTSFPKNPPQRLLESFGVFEVGHAATPEFDPATQRVATSAAPSLIDGQWTLTKTVEQQTPEQIAINTANKASQVRAERNKKISATDWTQLPDSAADKASWAAYRQALRDITAQAGFPWTIDWPVQP
jgi:hypothetical protein